MSLAITNNAWFHLLSVTALSLVLSSDSYKPVIIIHGILDGAEQMMDLKKLIEAAHPGTKVHIPDLFDKYFSFLAMHEQLKEFRKIAEEVMNKSTDGVHLIGFSQGGLLARGLIQTTDHHNVDSFISLSAPQNGQYGDTVYVNKILPKTVKEDMYKVFYTSLGQDISIGNYWKDPHHIKEYMEYSAFLSPLNNESSTVEFLPSWQANFMRLGNVVLIGGPDDGVITPWQSSQFACFNDEGKVVPMRELKIYQDDVFGLKTLDKNQRLHECTVSKVKHIDWHGNNKTFSECIEPWLT